MEGGALEDEGRQIFCLIARVMALRVLKANQVVCNEPQE